MHSENILAARRAPWLVIDRMAGLADVDPGRTRLWLFARAVQESAGGDMAGADTVRTDTVRTDTARGADARGGGTSIRNSRSSRRVQARPAGPG